MKPAVDTVNPATQEAKVDLNRDFISLFTEGVVKGLGIGMRNMMPNVMLAFILIHALNVTGLLKWIGDVAGPVMALWFLPGVTITVLLASLLSMGGAIGVLAALLASGAIGPYEATVLVPACYLMGNPVQNVGRCLGTAEVESKYYGIIIFVCVFNALASIWAMELLLTLF